MAICILGLMTNEKSQQEYTFDNEYTAHMAERDSRRKLVSLKAEPLYYFEVFRSTDKSRQIHCLLEDATIIIFNKESKKIITILIANRDLIDKYIDKTSSTSDEKVIQRLYRCAKLNKQTGADKVNENINLKLSLKEYHKRKNSILNNRK